MNAAQASEKIVVFMAKVLLLKEQLQNGLLDPVLESSIWKTHVALVDQWFKMSLKACN